MHYWGYIRVSGDEQADRGLPVAGQRERIAQYAAEHDGAISRWFVDEARPGSSDRRDAFQLMMRLAHAEPPPVSSIIIWSWSRFSRDQDDAHFWKASLRRQGIQILAVEDAIPPGTGMDYVFEALIHWKDQQRLSEIGHDARRGQQTLARMGYIPSGGPPPRGYKVEMESREIEGRRRNLRRWVVDPVTGPAARRAWEMRLAGASYAAIIRETRLYKSPACLSTFYPNTAYKGVVTFGDVRIEVEPLVTPEEWAMVNANRSSRRGGAASRRQGSRFLLSGLVRCALCGAPLAGDYSPAGQRNDGHYRQRWDHYRCLTAKRGGDCPLPRVGARELEAAVLDYVYTSILNRDALTAHIAALQAEVDADRPAVTALIQERRQQLARARGQVDNLVGVIESTGNAALVERLTVREAEVASIDGEIADLEARLAHEIAMPDVDAIREHLQQAAADDVRAARMLLKTLIREVSVSPDTLVITARLPDF